MPSTRRTFLTTTVLMGSLLAGCNDTQESGSDRQYEVYIRNETHQPYEVTLEVLDENEDARYTESGDGVLTPDEAEFFGPFDVQPSTLRVVGEPLHDDQNPPTWSTAYRPPDEECPEVVLSRLFLGEEDVEHDSRCREY